MDAQLGTQLTAKQRRWCPEEKCVAVASGGAMKLRHATPQQNLPSIFQEGLDPLYAVTESDKKYVWLHLPGRTAWAIQHTVRRKKVSQNDVAILEVTVPRGWLWRAWRGVWKCPDLIPPERVRVVKVDEGDS